MIGALGLSLGLGVAVGRLASARSSDSGDGVASGDGVVATRGVSAKAASSATHAAEPIEADGLKRYRIPVSSSQPSLGPADALVTIVEWCDLPDAGCSAVDPTLDALRAQFPNELRLVFRHYARPNESSALAHKFARAAHEQGGKFWEARRLLLAHRGDVTQADVERYAGRLGLDWKAVSTAMAANQQTGHITADRLFAGMFDVRDAPALFVNGRPLEGTPTADALEALIIEELARGRQLVASGVRKDEVYAQLTKDGAWNRRPAAAQQ
jgi:protein-disulfide isomerase